MHKVLDEWLAIPGGERAARFSGLLFRNETGMFLFSLLQSDQDVKAFIEYLRENSLPVEDDK